MALDMEQHLKARRAEILSAALEIFDAYGYDRATIDLVAAKAGIAKGSIYNYFRTKQDLFTSVFFESVSADMAQADEILASTDFTAFDKLEWMMDQWFVRFGHYQKIGRLVLDVMAAAAHEGEEGKLSQVLQNLYASWRGRVVDVLEQGKRSGEFQGHVESVVAASLIMGVLDGVVIQAILKVGVQVDQEFLNALKRGLLAGLTAQTASQPKGENHA